MNTQPLAETRRPYSASLADAFRGAIAVAAAVAALAASAAPPSPPPYPADACGFVRGATGCTANDTGIVSIALDPNYANPASCTVGNNVTVALKVTVGTTAAERYNIGVLFSKDGKDPTENPATTGAASCWTYAMPQPPFLNLDDPPNVCGDLTSVASPKEFLTGPITVPCLAGDLSLLKLPAVALWDNQTASCSGVVDLVAGTSAKCKVNLTQTVPITVVTPRGLTLQKTWVNGIVGNAISVETTGLTNNASVVSVSSGGNTTVGTQKFNAPGALVTLPAETFTTGLQANYTTTVACVGATPSSATLPATFTMPDNDVTCTYTNTRKSATLQLKKQWANAKTGDTAALTATGLVNSATVALNSTADSANELDAGSAVTVFAGEVGTLGETVNPAANYTSTGPSCTGTSGLAGSTLTVGGADTAIVCTYTNTRKSATLQLKKQWSSAKTGDTAALTATGLVNSATAALNSTADSANELDAGSTVTVFAGEVATLGETVNPAANYTSTGPSCTGTSGLVGSTLTVGAADTTIVCTYTNTRKSATLQLKKQWTNAKVGDTAAVTATGLVNSATVALNSTADAANELDAGSAVTVFAGEVATLSETVNPEANYTSTGPVCTGTSGQVGRTLTVGGADTAIVCTYTNTRKSATLQLKKQWASAKVGDTAALTATGLINSATAALNSTADSANELDAGTIVTVFAGEVATLGETVNPAANYTSTGPACTGTSGLAGSTLTVGAADSVIVCTYTNTRKSATLQLKKQWSSAKVGDTAALTATGITNSATVALNSTADSANELDAGTIVTVFAGEVATLGETVNPAANYTSTGPACTGTSGLAGSTLTVGAADTVIVCTYTNTRKSATLQLKKQWASAKVGDTAALTATGLINSATAALNSTADSANELDAGTIVTVFAGEVATLGETVNPAANYTSTGPACTGTSGLAGSTLTVGAADTVIVCTYTNTRKSATLQLKKQWSSAKVGDTAALTATGITNSATVALNSTADAANELDAGSAVTVFAGEVATLGETVNPAANYTSTGPACTGTSGLVGSTLTVGAADTTIVCTYTNTRKSATLQLRKQWTNAKVGDTAALTATGITNSATAALNSTADSANELEAGTAVAVFVGEVATLGETVNPAANYTSTGPVCTGTSGLAGSTLTVGAADTAIVCTYTNARVARNLTLRKVWVNGKNGDAITVTTAGLANNASVSLTTTGNNSTDGTPVSNAPGAVVTLPAETFTTGNALHYTTTVACTGATLSGSTPGSTFTMPDNDVTCTYTNTRRSAILQLINVWINAVVGDQINDAANGITNSAGVALTSVAGAANETDVGPEVTVYAGELAGLVQGAVTGSGSSYLQSFSCVGNASPVSVGNLAVTDADVKITCTFVNERVVRAPPPAGVAVIPTMSEYGMMLMAAILAIMGALATRRRRTR